MIITTQVAVAAGDQVRMVFTGATNPSQPGAYTLRVATSTDAGGVARYDLVGIEPRLTAPASRASGAT